jgi:para-nitrobenzyl esterase
LLAALLMASARLPRPGAVEMRPRERAGQSVGEIRVFKGIPYAQPPVGPLRWKAPAALPAWQGVRKATAFGAGLRPAAPARPSIYANPPAKISEDCLTLNIWAPEKAKNAPVLVWIHGGALVDRPAARHV